MEFIAIHHKSMMIFNGGRPFVPLVNYVLRDTKGDKKLAIKSFKKSLSLTM